MPNLWLVFTTGLLAGGVTCAAIQGGLLATCIANSKIKDQNSKSSGMVETVFFLISKLVAYTILGFGLGWVGSKLQLSPQFFGWLQAGVAVYMLGVGLAMLQVHPIFRYFVIQPPRFLTRMVRNQAKAGTIFAPAALGAMTVFIPCGTTQAMMALAVASGSPVWGAAILGTFVLGTGPLFMGLGIVMSKLGDLFRERFLRYAAWVVVGMAVWSGNLAAVVLGSPVTIQGVLARAECAISYCEGQVAGMVSDRVTVEINKSGYSVSNSVRAGDEIKMTLVNTDGRGCQQAVTIPSLGISKIVRPGQSQEISFKAPQKPGELMIACAMGMYTGSIKII